MGSLRDWPNGPSCEVGAPVMSSGLGSDWDWDLELDQDVIDDMERYLAEWDAIEDELNRLVELLAWLCRQIIDPKPLNDCLAWPKLWIVDWDKTTEIAMREPLLFDLARHQAAYIIKNEPDDRQLSAEDEIMTWLRIGDLLEASHPSAHGKKSGYFGFREIIAAIDAELSKESVWGDRRLLNPHKAPNNPTLPIATLALKIHERLNEHPILAEHPQAVLSVEALRPILRSIRTK